jgi:Cu-processing system permease protein
MSLMLRLLRFRLGDLVRTRWLPGYALFFVIAGEGLFRLGGGDARALLSLANLVLFVVPLVCLIFGTSYLYDARDFNELLLAQPLTRAQLYAGLYGGLALGLSAAFVAGIAVPFALHGLHATAWGTLLALIVAGLLLTFAFVAIAFLVALACREKARGLTAAIAVWLLLTIVYDGVVLLAANAFVAFPLERPMIAFMLLNPVDLARVLLLMRLDVAALMGYTGAIFERFFGSGLGAAAALSALLLWTIGPALLGLRAFRRQDF